MGNRQPCGKEKNVIRKGKSKNTVKRDLKKKEFVKFEPGRYLQRFKDMFVLSCFDGLFYLIINGFKIQVINQLKSFLFGRDCSFCFSFYSTKNEK